MDGLNNMNNTSNMSNTLLNLPKTQIKKQKTIKYVVISEKTSTFAS